MKAYTITPKGQVTIPAEIREKLKLYPGDKITYEDTAAGILLKPAKKDMIDDFGFLKERKHSEDLEEIRNSVRKKIANKILRWKRYSLTPIFSYASILMISRLKL